MKYDRTKIIRCGDRVKIINPQFFVRCGYPLTKEDIKRDFITNEERGLIEKLLGITHHTDHIESLLLNSSFRKTNETYEKILDDLAFYKLKQKGFGGSERNIFTIPRDEFKNTECQVVGKRVVQTGVYAKDYDCGDYGEYYSSWSFLSHQKSHVILSLNIWRDSRELEIEASNVEKLGVVSDQERELSFA